MLARAAVPVRTRHPKAGWVEHDAAELWRSQERALAAVLAALPRDATVSALGIAAQRSTIVAWDSRTGRPLAPALSWQDGRAADRMAALADRQAEVHEKTGLYLTPYYSAPKIAWLLERVPAVSKAAAAGTLRLGPVGSFLLWKLTGGASWATDPTFAQRTLLMNLRELAWDGELLAAFGVPREALPPIGPSIGPLGELRRGGRTIPIRALLGDQQAAAAALGAGAPGSGLLNYGTGAFFLLHSGSRQHRVPGLLTSAAWRNDGSPCEFFLEGTVHAAATSLEWLRENLGLLPSIERLDRECARSATRAFALPAIGGLGAPRWDYRTYSAFVGLTSRSRREDLVRAVTEGIGFLLADIVAACRRAGVPIDTLRASGGLSRSSYLLQFQADLLQSPIFRLEEREATAIGAAMMAATAAGWTLKPRLGRATRVAPRMAAAEAERLRAGWTVFVEAQQKLSERLRELKVVG